jgi:short-subunit dehydrogenase
MAVRRIAGPETRNQDGRDGILRGKTALVTGASSGLGADFARELAARGCGLILVARREDLLRALQEEVKAQHGVDVTILPCDLTAPHAVENLYDQVLSLGPTVDVLINNAGYGLYGLFADIPWEREHNMLELDIIVPTHLTKLFLPGMLERRFGYILQVSSIGAYQPSPTYASYSSAKSYILYFGEALNYELRNTGVSCTVLSPGVTATDFLTVSGQRPTLYQRAVMMQSADVVRIGIDAMLRGRGSVVPGPVNALMAWSNRFMPRRLSAAVAHRLMTMR